MELNKKQVTILGISASLISMLVMTIALKRASQGMEVIKQEQGETEIVQLIEGLEKLK